LLLLLLFTVKNQLTQQAKQPNTEKN